MPTTTTKSKAAKFNLKDGPKMRTSMSIYQGLHDAIMACAKADNRSFNNYIEIKLAEIVEADLAKLD